MWRIAQEALTNVERHAKANKVRVVWRCNGQAPALEAKDLAAAKAMLKNPGITVLEVARRLGVAASTLYRHLPRARTAALDA